MPRGTTVVELLAALAILALLAGIGVPSVIRARDRALVALHAREIAAAHADTRQAARLAGGRAELVVTATGYRQRRMTASGFLATWSRPGPARDGVALTGPATPIVFDSRGFALGASNRTYRLARGQASARVVISRLGRLRILP